MNRQWWIISHESCIIAVCESHGMSDVMTVLGCGQQCPCPKCLFQYTTVISSGQLFKAMPLITTHLQCVFLSNFKYWTTFTISLCTPVDHWWLYSLTSFVIRPSARCESGVWTNLCCASAMNSQEHVKDTYLRVIEATIAGAKEEFAETEGLNDALSGTLDLLRERWEARLMENHDFTEDPTAARNANARGGAGGKKAASAQAGTGAGAAGASEAAGPAAPETGVGKSDSAAARATGKARVGDGAVDGQQQADGLLSSGGLVPSLAAPTAAGSENFAIKPASLQPTLLNPLTAPAPPGHVPVPGVGHVPLVGGLGTNPLAQQAKVEGTFPGSAAAAAYGAPVSLPPILGDATPTAPQSSGSGITPGDIPQGDAPGSSVGSPPAKRPRHDKSDEVVNDNENLDSSDDDDDMDGDGGSDAEADNYILAQHDSVKKGGGNGKWKVRLKDGILHLNGRDYLFSKASCDLDW